MPTLDIPDGVPALGLDQPAAGVRSQTDIGRTPWLGRARWQLERARVADRAPEPEHELLDSEMPGVRRWLRRVTSTEGHDQRPIEREGDALEGIEVRIADAPLDPTLDHATEAGSLSQLGASPTATFAHRLDLGPDASEQLAVAAVQVKGALRSSDARHDRAMFIHGPSRAISCDVRDGGTWASALRRPGDHSTCFRGA